MPTTGLVTGTKLRLFDGATAIGRATDCSVSFDVEAESTSDKDSAGGWTEVTLGDKSGKGQCEMFIEEATGGWKTLFEKFLAGTSLTIKMTSGVTGDMVISGTAYITSCELKGTHKQKATGSVSFTFSGAVTKTVAA